jgi:hypothetical protein
MANILGIIGEGVKAVTGLVDEIVTTDEERKKLKNALRQQMNNFALSIEGEVSKRHESDMKSDNWLSKSIRPLSLIFTTVMVTLFAMTDGNIGGFAIKPEYISLFQSLMLAQYAFYFGSRGMEKYQAFKAHKEIEKERERSKAKLEYKDAPKLDIN